MVILANPDPRRDLSHLLLLVENSPKRFGDPHRETIERLRQLIDEHPEYVNNPPPDIVDLGSSVSLREVDSGDRLNIIISDPEEADIAESKISVLSPLGISLLGRRLGEFFWIDAPGGRIEYEIIEVDSKENRD